jgi:hypothetical protein
MAARIPKRLTGPAQLAGAAATIYTCPNPSSLPTGMLSKAIIRHIHLKNPDVSPITVTMSIGTDAASKRIFDADSIPAGGTLDHFGLYILEANEVIQAFASTASKIVYIIDGDEVITGG